MGHEVKLLPSGHVFEVQSRESLLDAGLREGLNLDHNCANGTCGACRARLVSGDLELIQHYDYRFSPREQADNVFLMCCHRPASAVEIEAHESGSAAEIPDQHIRAKLQKLELLQDDVMQLHVRTPRSTSLLFLAGQSVELHLDGMKPVSMALAGCPCDGMNLRFHVRRRPDDPFSDLVFERMKKGREVVIRGPLGDFTLDDASPRPILFLAWESGFAPIASLIDHAIQLDEGREMHLYWLSGLEGGHYLSNYCRAWRDALDDFHYHDIDLAPAGEGSFDTVMAQIVQRHGDLAGWDCYAVLPEEGLQALDALKAAGLPEAQLRTSLKRLP
jgi:CDP-4-dehydro-6-deoxyglucose reductase